MTETLWHPCSQMKDYELFKPLEIESAKGSLLTLRDGRQIIDAISSWWCKSLGHGHPRLISALIEQSQKLEHVLLANTTNPMISLLSDRLSQMLPGRSKVFYASDGSCAVEIALKLAMQTQALRGSPEKTQFACLQGAYHGETLFTLAVSDMGQYRQSYQAILPKTQVLDALPWVHSDKDPLFQNCESHWVGIETALLTNLPQLAAVIVEPIVQGAAGMRIYSADLLRRLSAFCKQHQLFLICDEIMTGFGRTGYALAIEHAGITPDLVCLGKGLTGGVLPMSAVLISDEIYQEYYADYGTGRDFLHSHTYSGHIIAASVANACLDVYRDENIFEQVRENADFLREHMLEVARITGKLTNVRAIGAIAAADLPDDRPRAGYAVFKKAVELGALLRPLGNTIYWLPPLNASRDIISRLAEITTQSIQEAL